MDTYDYDLFVIGAGSGGVRCARIAASLGAKVAVAEERYYGGTCVNVGCVPKKLFVYASHVAEELEQASSFGWDIPSRTFNWPTLIKNKNKEISRLNGIYSNLLVSNGVDVIDGTATIESPYSLTINKKTITTRHILIATGGWPQRPDITGIEYAISSNEFFYLDTLPKKMMIIGGGYIALEFACIVHNLGVEVEVSYRGELFLRGFDDDVRQHMKNVLTEKGIKLHFNHTIEHIEKDQNGLLHVSSADNNKTVVDTVIYATGRKPKTDGLGLENTSIQCLSSGAIQVDDNYKTNEDSIYAVGDVIDRVQLTPVALAEGMFVAHHLFGEPRPAINYQAIPSAVFTQPPIGSVGLTEQQAISQGYEVSIYRSAFSAMKYSFMEEKEKTLMKLVVDIKTDKVLGAHMVGPDAGEIIQGIGIAINMGATKAQFDQTIGIHPTSAEEFVTMRTPV